jgi:hypothetical protein
MKTWLSTFSYDRISVTTWVPFPHVASRRSPGMTSGVLRFALAGMTSGGGFATFAGNDSWGNGYFFFPPEPK